MGPFLCLSDVGSAAQSASATPEGAESVSWELASAVVLPLAWIWGVF